VVISAPELLIVMYPMMPAASAEAAMIDAIAIGLSAVVPAVVMMACTSVSDTGDDSRAAEANKSSRVRFVFITGQDGL
jgi:hypothetical protein